MSSTTSVGIDGSVVTTKAAFSPETAVGVEADAADTAVNVVVKPAVEPIPTSSVVSRVGERDTALDLAFSSRSTLCLVPRPPHKPTELSGQAKSSKIGPESGAFKPSEPRMYPKDPRGGGDTRNGECKSDDGW